MSQGSVPYSNQQSSDNYVANCYHESAAYCMSCQFTLYVGGTLVHTTDPPSDQGGLTSRVEFAELLNYDNTMSINTNKPT